MYNLGGLSFNVSKLKKDQIKEMTKFLISMKSEYDQLIKESTQIKANTEKLGVTLTSFYHAETNCFDGKYRSKD